MIISSLGPKSGGCAPLVGAGSPSNAMWPAPRPTYVPYGDWRHVAAGCNALVYVEKRRQGTRSRTEADLFAGIGRLKEGGEGEDGGERAWDDDVEPVVERQSSQVDRERDVDVLLRAALVLDHVALRQHLYRHPPRPIQHC